METFRVAETSRLSPGTIFNSVGHIPVGIRLSLASNGSARVTGNPSISDKGRVADYTPTC